MSLNVVNVVVGVSHKLLICRGSHITAVSRDLQRTTPKREKKKIQ